MRNNWQNILDYLRGRLTSKEAHRVERDALDDPFLSDALEGLEDHDSRLIEKDLAELKGRLQQRSEKRIYWPAIAAAVALLITSGLVWFFWPEMDKPDSVATTEQVEEDAVADTISEAALEAKQQHDTTMDQQNIALADEPVKEVNDQPISPRQGKSIKEESEEELAYLDLVIEELRTEPMGTPEDDIEGKIPEVEPLALNDLTDKDETRSKKMAKNEITGDASEGVMMEEAEISAPKAKAGRSELTASASEVVEPTEISGVVLSSDDGAPIPGVNVILKGKSTGTITDINGQFEIDIPKNTDNPILVFSFIGMSTEEIAIDENEGYLEVMMAADIKALSEVVVSGYGVDSRENAPVRIGPRPEGGFRALKKHIRDSQQLPEGFEEKKGFVKLSLSIDASGEIDDMIVESYSDERLINEAIRLVRSGPEWQPGTVDGNPQTMKVSLKVKFKDNE